MFWTKLLKLKRGSSNVPGAAGSSRIDYDQLTVYLRVLGVPNRLALLRKLQVPHALSEISLAPSRKDPTHRQDRPISRQALERHLKTLQALGLVLARAGERRGRGVTEYVVNHARLFILTDELRRLSLIRPVSGDASATVARQTLSSLGRVALPPGPCLVTANGPIEGAAFALHGDGPWTIGREKGHAVALPYDPFVSKENSSVRRDGPRFLIRSLPGARNGTRLNWRPLDEKEEAPLAPGDAVGVGRSLLFFRSV